MSEDYSNRLLETIKKRSKKQVVTVDLLIEDKSFDNSEKVVVAIQQLIRDGKLTALTCNNNGRFETRLLIPGEEVLTFITKPKKQRKVLEQKQKQKRTTKKVNRSLLK